MRTSRRSCTQVRDISITYDVFPYAAGSVLFCQGNTRVLCAITIQPGVPAHLRGQKSGWLTAEYALLPAATHIRTVRDVAQVKRNGRVIEISRLIGRVLRAVIDLSAFGERTIVVDCDILQADGGTRTASITAASLALMQAQQYWLDIGLIQQPIMRESVVGLSVGYDGTRLLIDPDYEEDSQGDADFNFVLTKSKKLVEIQGGAERSAIDWGVFNTACTYAQEEAEQLFERITQLDKQPHEETRDDKKKTPLFSLINRGLRSTLHNE